MATIEADLEELGGMHRDIVRKSVGDYIFNSATTPEKAELLGVVGEISPCPIIDDANRSDVAVSHEAIAIECNGSIAGNARRPGIVAPRGPIAGASPAPSAGDASDYPIDLGGAESPADDYPVRCLSFSTPVAGPIPEVIAHGSDGASSMSDAESIQSSIFSPRLH